MGTSVPPCIHNLCFEQKLEKYHNLSSENYHFYSREKSFLYIAWACYRNDPIKLLLFDYRIFYQKKIKNENDTPPPQKKKKNKKKINK